MNNSPSKKSLELQAARTGERVVQALSHIDTYDFASAVRLLRQVVHGLQGKENEDTTSSLYHRAFGPLRFRSTLRLAHPSSALSHVEFTKVGPQQQMQPVLWVQFVGMAGLQGPLALPFTERILNNLKQKDGAAASFLDIFNHRIALLFYDTQKWIPGSALCPPERSSLGKLVLSLGGMDAKAPPPAACPDLPRYLLTFKTLFWQRVRSRAGLELILSFFLKAKVHVEEYQGETRQLPETEITRLGPTKGQKMTLGRDAFLGQRVWNAASGISILITPATLEHYALYNPYLKGSFYRHLQQLIRAYLPQRLRVKVFLKAPRESRPPLRLGHPNYLGFDTWLGQAPSHSVIPLRG